MYSQIIIDGNNLLHSDMTGLFGDHRANFPDARQGLVRVLEPLEGRIADKIIVVFDGTRGGSDEAVSHASLQVIYSPADKSADSVIERTVSESADPERILVVSSDKLERDTVVAAGAATMSCSRFIEFILDSHRELEKQMKTRRYKAPRNSLGDFFPK